MAKKSTAGSHPATKLYWAVVKALCDAIDMPKTARTAPLVCSVQLNPIPKQTMHILQCLVTWLVAPAMPQPDALNSGHLARALACKQSKAVVGVYGYSFDSPGHTLVPEACNRQAL